MAACEQVNPDRSVIILKCKNVHETEEWTQGTLCYSVVWDEMGYLKCGSSQQNGKDRIRCVPKACAKWAIETQTEKNQETFPLGTKT